MLRHSLFVVACALCSMISCPVLGQELSQADKRTLCDFHSRICDTQALLPISGGGDTGENRAHTRDCCNCVFYCGSDNPPSSGPLWLDASKAVTCLRKLNQEANIRLGLGATNNFCQDGSTGRATIVRDGPLHMQTIADTPCSTGRRLLGHCFSAPRGAGPVTVERVRVNLPTRPPRGTAVNEVTEATFLIGAQFTLATELQPAPPPGEPADVVTPPAATMTADVYVNEAGDVTIAPPTGGRAGTVFWMPYIAGRIAFADRPGNQRFVGSGPFSGCIFAAGTRANGSVWAAHAACDSVSDTATTTGAWNQFRMTNGLNPPWFNDRVADDSGAGGSTPAVYVIAVVDAQGNLQRRFKVVVEATNVGGINGRVRSVEPL